MTTGTIRAIGLAAAVTMVAAIAYGFASGGFGEDLRTILEAPWGRVTFIDLVIGLVLIGTWIVWRERSLAKAIPWLVGLVVTGNLASGLYIARAAWTAPTAEAFLTGRTESTDA